MAEKQQHIIHKHALELEINVSDEGESYVIQQRILEEIKERALPALDDLFSELIPPDMTLRLNTLELDLGEIDVNDIETSLLKLLRQQVEEEIIKRRERARVKYEERKRSERSNPFRHKSANRKAGINEEIAAEKDWLEDFEKPEASSGKRGRSTNTDDSRLFGPQESESSSLLHYLETGSWPWHLLRKKKDAKTEADSELAVQEEQITAESELAPANLIQKWIREKPAELLRVLILARPSERAIRRLLVHLTDAEIAEFIRLAAPAVATQVEQIVKDLEQLMSAQHVMNKPRYEIRQEIWLAVLSELLALGESSISSERASKRIIAEANLSEGEKQRWFTLAVTSLQLLPASSQASGARLRTLLRRYPSATDQTAIRMAILLEVVSQSTVSTTVSKRWVPIVKGWLEKNTSTAEQKQLATIAKSLWQKDDQPAKGAVTATPEQIVMSKKSAAKAAGQISVEEAEKLATAPKTKRNTRTRIAVDESVEISDAGFVIAAPFMIYLFRGLELLNGDDQFVDQNAIYTAIHMCWQVGNGKPPEDESDLLLSKVICGFPAEEVVPLDHTLSGEIKAECDNVLKVILQRWDVVGKSTPERLRSDFLQRPGLLNCFEPDWGLTVEREMIDVLLDRLPWGYTTHKFPWSHYILSVTW